MPPNKSLTVSSDSKPIAKVGPDFGIMGLALATAQAHCEPVPKNGYNSYQKYHYPLATDVIEVGKQALLKAGLVLTPVDSWVEGYEKEGPDRFQLCTNYLLIHHESKNVMPIKWNWPVVIEKGRPLDKAVPIAMTNSLSYLYSRILSMPRGEAEEPNDNKPTEQPKTEEQAMPPKPTVNGEPEVRWTQVDEKQLDQINSLAVGIPNFNSRLKELYGTDDPLSLSSSQANDLIAKLIAKSKKDGVTQAT